MDRKRLAKLEEIAAIARDVIYRLHEERASHSGIVLDMLLPLRLAINELAEMEPKHGPQETEV